MVIIIAVHRNVSFFFLLTQFPRIILHYYTNKILPIFDNYQLFVNIAHYR